MADGLLAGCGLDCPCQITGGSSGFYVLFLQGQFCVFGGLWGS